MGHSKPESRSDLTLELGRIRSLEAMVEKKPGIFYLGNVPFLHFHDKDGRRWADLKVKTGWRSLPIDVDAGNTAKRAFLKSVLAAHQVLLSRKKGRS